MWKPKVGDYAVSKRTNKLYNIIGIEETNRKFLPQGFWAWVDYEDFRPAVLDDFVVNIEGWGKVWFVDYGDRIIVENPSYPDLPTEVLLKELPNEHLFFRSFDQFILNIIMPHITVIPQDLWNKLKG